MNKRVLAGLKGKIGGHAFERAFAKKYNINKESIDGGSRTKVDIKLNSYNLSLKNPKKSHTQVALISSQSWLKEFQESKKYEEFIYLFFGHPDISIIKKICSKHQINFYNLSLKNERTRQRLLASNIPDKLKKEGLDSFNENQEKIFDILFVSGINQLDCVDVLGWAWTKDSIDSVKFYDLNKMKNDFINKSYWSFSPTHSTIWCLINGKKILHLQMKGSGKPKYISWGYHGMMFHMYDTFLDKKYEISRDYLFRN